MPPLSYAERQRLPASVFAYPRTRRYPLEDIRHARNALSRVATFGTPAERRRVRAEVHRRYPSIEIDRSNPMELDPWGRNLKAYSAAARRAKDPQERYRMVRDVLDFHIGAGAHPATIRAWKNRARAALQQAERRNPDNPDLLSSLLPITILLGGGVLLVGWLSSGGSATLAQGIGNFFSGVGSAAHAAGGPQGGASQPPAPVTPSANTGDNQFNFSDDPADSYALQNSSAGNTTGHFGFGHVGPGGTFVATISARAGGGPFGIGRVDKWSQIWQGNIDVGNDADWTGYGIDFTGNTPPLGLSSEDVQASIDGLSGEHYANLTLKAHQGA